MSRFNTPFDVKIEIYSLAVFINHPSDNSRLYSNRIASCNCQQSMCHNVHIREAKPFRLKAGLRLDSQNGQSPVRAFHLKARAFALPGVFSRLPTVSTSSINL